MFKGKYSVEDFGIFCLSIIIVVIMGVAAFSAITSHQERPYAFCNHCGWYGDRSELESHFNAATKTTHYECPNCGSDDIIYIGSLPHRENNLVQTIYNRKSISE